MFDRLFNKGKDMGINIKGFDVKKIVDDKKSFIQAMKLYFSVFNDGIAVGPDKMDKHKRDEAYMFTMGYQLGREIQRQIGDNDKNDNATVEFVSI